MATKTISITEDAYDDLKALRLRDESFSDAIQRLNRAKGSLRDCFGLWKDLKTDEKDSIDKAIAAGRQTTRDLLKKIHGQTA
ncbi:antitoxin VapB family protein [Candidatus Woesearchaeota archaeon]|nr:antitoxin VapB family protein [Candidatus Woesearchaeota archaeon]